MKRLSLVFSLLLGLTVSGYSYSSSIILKDMQGQKIFFESFRGKWVLINYWASWCQPCLDEINELNRFYKKNKDKAVLFAVNFERLPVFSQKALIRKYGINYPSLQYDPASVLGLGHILGVPVTFVFNPQGRLSATLYGEQTLKRLSKFISG